MKILFPQNPQMRKLAEPTFEPEYDAARALGFETCLADVDALTAGNVAEGLKLVPAGAGEVLYRGWILTEERYRLLEHGLHERGFTLVSSADAYAEVTYFPNYAPKIRDHTPAFVWTTTPDIYAAWSASRQLGNGPFVFKDHVKSAKHNWYDACFVPKGAGREAFERVAENLKRAQGDSFFRGFVVKEYVPLKSAGTGPKEYPRCEEYRLFFWKGKVLSISHYHAEREGSIPVEVFVEVARRFNVPFFSMDVAQTEAGRWIIVDMGAGECSRLPPNLTPEAFYRRLRELS